MLPAMSFLVSMPELLDPEPGNARSRVNQAHNQAVKAAGALQAEIELL